MKRCLPKHASPRRGFLAGAALLTGGSLILNGFSQGTTPAPNPKLVLKLDEAPMVRNAADSYGAVAQKVAPSVVRISVTLKGRRKPLLPSERDFFGRFFDQPGPGEPGFGEPGPGEHGLLGPEREHGVGSGVIVSADGYIVTNHHLVQNARDIQVSLNDGRTLPAKVIGTDPATDVALIKIDAQSLPFLTFANSDNVLVGDVVLAIGNPFGIGETVTHGIVSAKNRVTFGDRDEDFIQTDAAINPGNSGGALVDTEGRLVGINSAILSRSGGHQGIGFAVPSNLVRWVTDNLTRHGRVQRGLVGVTIQDLNGGLAQALKTNRSQGALVSDVTPNSAADAAGLKSGDVILKFGDQPIRSANQLKLRVAESTPGTVVPIEVDRNGEIKTLNVTIRERPGDRLAEDTTPAGPAEEGALRGVTVTNLDEASRAEWKVPASVQGAIITEVDSNSPAYEAGLRPGDVITEINRQPVHDADDSAKLTQQPSHAQTLVKVWSQGGSRYVAVDEAGGTKG